MQLSLFLLSMIFKQVRSYGIWLLTFVTLLYVFFKLSNFTEWGILKNHLLNSITNPLLYFTLLLPLLNFGTESIKWQLLLNPSVNISLKQSFGAVIGGITTGILTPARVGEIGARVLLLRESERALGGAMFVVGSLIQTIITIMLGIGALLWINNGIWIASTLFYLMIIIGCIILIWGVYLLVKHLHPKLPVFIIIERYSRNFKSITMRKLLAITGLSLFKYLVYSTQLFIALKLFNPSLSLNLSFPLISIFYLGITFLPGFLLADLGIRGSLSIFLFSSIIQSSLLIIVPVFFLWILNSCLPAIIGLWIIRKKRRIE